MCGIKGNLFLSESDSDSLGCRNWDKDEPNNEGEEDCAVSYASSKTV